jgi:hypothetical protein
MSRTEECARARRRLSGHVDRDARALIQTARLNDVDPQAWLADVLARINDHNIQKLDQLLPWNWKIDRAKLAA